jgi:DNA-binding MarR family transcriptional regulator
MSLLDREGPVTVTELAKAEGVRSQTMGATLASLEAEGLVLREPDPGDGRQMLASLTDKGRDELARAREVKQTWLTAVMAERLSAEEQKILSAAVELLLRLV